MASKEIAVRLSKDAGNALGWGSDGGLLAHQTVVYGGVADELGLGLSPDGSGKRPFMIRRSRGHIGYIPALVSR